MKTQAPRRGKTADQARPSKTGASIRFGRPQPTNEIKPSQIHELRMKTLQVQNQTKMQKSQLNRLKNKIANKTEAINRTVNRKSEDRDSKNVHQITIAQLQRSIEAAENTIESLQTELEEAQFDDRTAAYQELEEEVKATYLEYDRITSEIQTSREEAKKWDEKLKMTDARADPEHVTNLEMAIRQARATNAELREKWKAYQVKMHKMNVEARIAQDRDEGKNAGTTVKEAEEEGDRVAQKIDELNEELRTQQDRYHRRVDQLMEVIDSQRRRIVEHLMGRDLEE